MNQSEEIFKLKLKSDATNLFVNNGADITQPNVIAAITDTASNMVLATDEAISPAEVQEAMLNIFGANENDEVRSLLGSMAPQFVKGITGFATDYMDYGAARSEYKASKQVYDNLYDGLTVVSKNISDQITK